MKLRDEYRLEGRQSLFDALKICLTQTRPEISYSELSAVFAMSEGALRVAAHRMRRRYRELLRQEIADTVSSPQEVEEELRHLFRVLAK